ncbi:phage minor structural protein,phage minor structural protein, N-terminal region,Prophage endopeptidase tail [[Clostridium] sordellii]|uniref:phage tail spike protein n=1 Tax=Paraclostridium sordellii TaxID=1505 RepID=UPI000543FBBB|nr:phage tail spike protein [Paeniclostridium sordellii]CEK34134.1 phage minor structural protein,phage minor structural protein, N-terminal region,Prophage endopeptidase tail [[Clostridium] sordellii] [Paeniclostridium sordellii]
MLNLSGKDKNKIAGLVDYKDLYIEKDLASGDKTLAFLYPKTSKFYSDIEEECYITTKEDEFIIKEKNVQNDYTEFKCILNLEDLDGKPWERYASEEQTIDKALALALAGTGWIVGNCSLKKKRTVRATNVSSLDIIQQIRKTYRCDLIFNTLTKTIDVYERLGEDKGTYFIDSLNLKNLSIQGNSYNFFTRIIPIGKDNLRISSINNGKDYLENYQYSNKVKTYYWIDERYTIVENLKEDAEAKLNEISKPYRAYVADIINLAKLNDKYKDILDFKLGDTVYLISKDNKFRDKQRIVKIIEHPDEHELDSVEIANTTLSFEEKQTQFEEAADTVNNITTDNGTIDGSTVDGIHTDQIYDFKAQVVQAVDLNVINAKITNLEAHNVNITGRLNSVEAHIGTLETNVATIDRLTVTHSASINDLQANKASITQLEVVNASIKVLEANVGKIETLVNGNLSSENIQAGGITSDKLTITNGFIKNAMIDSLDVSKVNAGDISTNKFRIKSDDGGIEIVGATQQFKDKNSKVRIQMGKDAQGNFNFIIRGEDGTTTLIDHTGVKSKAIADDLIVNNMIASNAVGEKQINYSSFTNGFNKDTNTNTLKATKVKLDNQNQNLEVAFNSLKTQADGTKTTTESNSTTINVIQGQINTAINNTQIVKDGQTILLKDDYNRTVQTVNSMNNTIGKHTTQINSATGKIDNVETKVNTVGRDLNSITARVSSTEHAITSIDYNISNNSLEIATTKNKVSVIETTLSSITSKVSNMETSQSTVNNKIISLETWKKEAEQKITDSSIISIVSKQFYSKGESDSKYTTQSQFDQLDTKFEFKLSQTGAFNLIVNSNFDADAYAWNTLNNPTLTTYNPQLPATYGKMLSISCNQTGGIFQRFKTIPGKKYTVSFYAESNNLKHLRTNIGIEGVRIITLEHEPGFKRWSFTFTSSKEDYTFIAYTIDPGTFYIGRIMINEGELQLYNKKGNEIFSSSVKIDINGIEIDSINASTTNIINNDGMVIVDKATNDSLFSVTKNRVTARGGSFYVDHPTNGYTLLWGRDIVINGKRAVVGAGDRDLEVGANKLFLNYNNDFGNGVEIGGRLTNKGNEVISNLGFNPGNWGYQYLSTGLMIQWGSFDNFGDGSTYVGFAQQFKSKCLGVWCQYEGDTEAYWTCSPLNLTLNSCFVRTKLISGPGDRARIIKWFAIGI